MAELTRGGAFFQYRVRPDPVQNRVKFFRWKNQNGKSFRKQHQHYRSLLKEEIQSPTKRCRCLREEVKLHERRFDHIDEIHDNQSLLSS